VRVCVCVCINPLRRKSGQRASVAVVEWKKGALPNLPLSSSLSLFPSLSSLLSLS
jgi:hypothetical protein